jgi:hypothetical protein
VTRVHYCINDNEETKSKYSREAVFLKRIRGHVKDVFAVLVKEQITTIYILGVCIGHPYAVELCRQCIPTSTSSTTSSIVPTVGGMTLVAPFVSTACPYAWRVARFGASWLVPSFVLWGATEVVAAASEYVVPAILKPKHLESLLKTEEERELWTSQQDFDDAYQMILKLTPLSKNSQGIEARLGVAKIWQVLVCDKFAKESGCSLVLDDEIDDDGGDDNKNQTTTPSCGIPIRIHASREDKLASLKSLEWISRRCYGNAPIIIEEMIHSHEVMTFLGGPPRNPVLLHKIASDWELLSTAIPLASQSPRAVEEEERSHSYTGITI